MFEAHDLFEHFCSVAGIHLFLRLVHCIMGLNLVLVFASIFGLQVFQLQVTLHFEEVRNLLGIFVDRVSILFEIIVFFANVALGSISLLGVECLDDRWWVFFYQFDLIILDALGNDLSCQLLERFFPELVRKFKLNRRPTLGVFPSLVKFSLQDGLNILES